MATDIGISIRVDDIPILMRFDDTETAALLYAWYQTDAFYREFAIPNFYRHTAQYPGRSIIVEGTTITLPLPEEYFAELNPFHKKVLKFFTFRLGELRVTREHLPEGEHFMLEERTVDPTRRVNAIYCLKGENGVPVGMPVELYIRSLSHSLKSISCLPHTEYFIMQDLYLDRTQTDTLGYHSDSGAFFGDTFRGGAPLNPADEFIEFVSLLMLGEEGHIDQGTVIIPNKHSKLDPKAPKLADGTPYRHSYCMAMKTGKTLFFSDLAFYHSTPRRRLLRAAEIDTSLGTDVVVMYPGPVLDTLSPEQVAAIETPHLRSFLRTHISRFEKLRYRYDVTVELNHNVKVDSPWLAMDAPSLVLTTNLDDLNVLLGPLSMLTCPRMYGIPSPGLGIGGTKRTRTRAKRRTRKGGAKDNFKVYIHKSDCYDFQKIATILFH